MALKASRLVYESREVSLRDKPAEMLAASPKGTVPVFITVDGTVIDESYDIMKWALRGSDPLSWLPQDTKVLESIDALVEENDTSFKRDLDAYKYSSRHPDASVLELRERALPYLHRLEAMLARDGYLFEQRCTIADVAVFPFIRQFRNVDPQWFDALLLNALNAWLTRFLDGDLFEDVMRQHAPAHET